MQWLINDLMYNNNNNNKNNNNKTKNAKEMTFSSYKIIPSLKTTLSSPSSDVVVKTNSQDELL